MLLTADEHCIGRLVEDTRFQIESNAVSANHCKIYRRKLALASATADDSDYSGFLKDTRFFILFYFIMLNASIFLCVLVTN